MESDGLDGRAPRGRGGFFWRKKGEGEKFASAKVREF